MISAPALASQLPSFNLTFTLGSQEHLLNVCVLPASRPATRGNEPVLRQVFSGVDRGLGDSGPMNWPLPLHLNYTGCPW